MGNVHVRNQALTCCHPGVGVGTGVIATDAFSVHTVLQITSCVFT